MENKKTMIIIVGDIWKKVWFQKEGYCPWADKKAFKEWEREGWFKLVKDEWKQRPNTQKEMKEYQNTRKDSHMSITKKVYYKKLKIFRKILLNCAICNIEGEAELELILRKKKKYIHYPSGFQFCKNCLEIIKKLQCKENSIKLDEWEYRNYQHPEHNQLRLRYIEAIRRELGLKGIRSSGEMYLRELIEDIFKGERVLLNDKITLLGLELDIFLPDKKLAFEYNGKQHFEPTTFGGISKKRAIKNLEKQKERDKLKRGYCEREGIKLIEIKYNEPLTTEHLFKKINTNKTKLKS